jgi:hypothetical protein
MSVAPSTSASGSTSGSPTSTSRGATTTKPEYLEFLAEDTLAAPDLLTLLDQTVNTASGATPASGMQLRNGLYLTATPNGANVILRVDADGGGVRPKDPYVEVAIPQGLGQTFRDLCDAAMATAALTAATPGLASPWNIFLHAESPSGGILELNVTGDATGVFAAAWKLDSPVRAVDAFGKPSAFGAGPGTAKVGGTVHFPIDVTNFKTYVNQAYGYNAPARFTDFALIPHTWLHLTVTGDAANRVVNVRFDAVLTSGARTYVCEAPASTDVGNRFFDETVARMNQMNAEEAAAPGSSKKWGTSFYYADAAKGVVDVVVKGEKGAFDIAYAVETPLFTVNP